MRSYIDVKNRKEAEMIRAGISDPLVRAFVKVNGALGALDKEERGRVLRYLCSYYGIPLI